MGHFTDAAPTVGILYPGEMGSALGRRFVQAGVRVVTTAEGRGPRTLRLCREAGLDVLDSIGAVKTDASIVISLVPPSAAAAVAAEFRKAPPFDVRPLYVDANSVSPETACGIARELEAEGFDFVDAAIAGLASRLGDQGTLYLSGRSAGRLAELTARAVRTKVVGATPGAASALKMMVGSFSKGLVALFVELALMARGADALDAVLEEYGLRYPAVMAVIERMVPTYPLHAARRGTELAEVGRTMQAFGLEPTVIRAAEALTVSMGRLNLAGATGRDGEADWTLRDVVEALFARGLLRPGAAADSGRVSSAALFDRAAC